MADTRGLDRDFLRRLQVLMESLPENIRRQVSLRSAWRSKGHQSELFDKAVKKYGSVSAARKWVAPPGRSQHGGEYGEGKAVDLGYGSTAAMRAVHAAAPKAGLVFPLSNENWHIEPIGARGGGGGAGRSQYGGVYESAGRQYGVSPGILARLVQKESSGNPRAVSPRGAIGLAQFLPATAKQFGVDPTDPESSITGAAKYLNYLKGRFNGDTRMALAAYNWGEGNVERAGSWDKIPASVRGYAEGILAGGEGVGTEIETSGVDQGGVENVTPQGYDPQEVQDFISNLVVQQQAQTDEIERQARDQEDQAEQERLALERENQAALTAQEDEARASAENYQSQIDQYQQEAEPSFLDSLSEGVSNATKQGLTGLAAAPVTAPANIIGWPLAGVDKGLQAATEGLRSLGLDVPDPQSLSQPLFDAADWANKNAEKTMGSLGIDVGEPEGYIQRLARSAPGNLAMTGRALPAAIVTGVNETWPIVNDWLGSMFNKTSEEKGREPLSEQQVVDTRSLMSDPLASTPLVGGGLQPNKPPERGLFGAIPNPLISSAVAAETGPASILSGPPLISDKKAFEVLGWPALITTGFGIAGYGAKGLKSWTGKPRPYRLDPSIAPPGTMSAMTWRDWAQGTGQNVWAPFDRLFRLPNVNTKMVEIAKQAQLETRFTGIGAAHAAVEKGRADTIAGKYGATVPLSLLRKMEAKNPDLGDYVHYRDILDWMQNEGIPLVQGRDRHWYHQEIAKIRQRTKPDQLKKYEDGYKENLQAKRDYGHGHVGTLIHQALFSVGGKLVTQTVQKRSKVTGNPLVHPRTKQPLTSQVKTIVSRPYEVPFARTVDAPQGKLPGPASLLYDDTINYIRSVNDNEAQLRTIDAVRSGKDGKQIFNQVTREEYVKNKAAYDKGTVVVWRNGKKEYYVTDPAYADILRIDPYYPAGMLPAIYGTFQRGLTNAMTGPFSFYGLEGTSFYRGWTMNALGNPSPTLSRDLLRRSNVSPLAGLIAIPRELLPKAAFALSQAFEASMAMGDNAGLWNMMKPQTRQRIADYLSKEYHRSMIGLIEESGTGQAGGSYMDITANKEKLVLMARLGNTALFKKTGLRSVWRAYTSMLHATHASNSAAYVFKNMRLIAKRAEKDWKKRGAPAGQAKQHGQDVAKGELSKLISEAANLSGNPRIEGQTLISENRGERSLRSKATGNGGVRFMSGPGKPEVETFLQKAGRVVGEPLGALTGATAMGLREGVPFGNTIIQSMTRLGQAYLQNPASFTLRLWTYVLGPATANYFWNKSQGSVGPDGKLRDEIVDYQMRGRSVYNSLVNMYVYHPQREGERKRPDSGTELSGPPEVSIIRHMWEIYLHHAFANNPQMFTTSEDMINAMLAYLPISVLPPSSTAESVISLVRGETPPPNLGADPGRPRKEAFPEPGSVPEWLDHLVRAFGGQVLNTVMLGYASMNDSYRNSEDGGWGDVQEMMKAGLKAMQDNVLQGGPAGQVIAPNLLRSSATDTWTNREYMRMKDQIDALGEFWSSVGQYTQDEYEPSDPQIDLKRAEQKGTDDRSTLGTFGGIVESGAKKMPYPGRVPAKPVNEFYKLFASRVQDQLMSNGKNDDVNGFLELQARRSLLSKAIESMKGVTEGYTRHWLERVKKGEQGEELRQMFAGVNPKDRNSAVKIQNNWMRELQLINGEMVKAVRRVEDLMSESTTTEEFRLRHGLAPSFKGWNIRLKDLDPYKKWTIDTTTGRVTDTIMGVTVKTLPEYKPRGNLE